MGFDQPKQSSSSGVVIVIVVAVLLVAILGIVAVAGAWLLWVRSSSMHSRDIAIENGMVAEMQRAMAEEHRAVAQVRITDGMVQIQQSSVVATAGRRLNFEVKLDREGNDSFKGERIGLDESGRGDE